MQPKFEVSNSKNKKMVQNFPEGLENTPLIFSYPSFSIFSLVLLSIVYSTEYTSFNIVQKYYILFRQYHDLSNHCLWFLQIHYSEYILHIVLTIVEGSGNRPCGEAGSTIPPTYFRDGGRSENLGGRKIDKSSFDYLEQVLLLNLPIFVRGVAIAPPPPALLRPVPSALNILGIATRLCETHLDCISTYCRK